MFRRIPEISLEVVSDPWEGLARAEGGEFDAIVCDMHLGDVRAREFDARVHARLGRASPPILFVSGGLYDDDDLAFAREHPVLLKPFSASDVREALARLDLAGASLRSPSRRPEPGDADRHRLNR